MWITAWDANDASGDPTWKDYTSVGRTARHHIKAADIQQVGGTKLRFTFKAHSTKAGEISGAAFGPKKASADPYDFTETPSRITFNDGQNSGALPAGGTLVSDEIPYTLEPDTDYLWSVYSSDGDMGYLNFSNGYWFSSKGYDDSQTVDTSGYSQGNYIEYVALIEVWIPEEGAEFAASVSGSASLAAVFTTAITAAASVVSSAIVAAALSTSIALGGLVSGSASISGAITSAITPAASVSAEASAAGALTTEITSAAAVTGSASATGGLTTAITTAAVVSATASVSADLTSDSEADLFAASLSGSAATAGDLTTEIRTASSVIGEASITGDLTTQIPLATAISASGFVTGILTTEIATDAEVYGEAAAVGELTTEIAVAASIMGSATAQANITTGTEIPGPSRLEKWTLTSSKKEMILVRQEKLLRLTKSKQDLEV